MGRRVECGILATGTGAMIVRGPGRDPFAKAASKPKLVKTPTLDPWRLPYKLASVCMWGVVHFA